MRFLNQDTPESQVYLTDFQRRPNDSQSCVGGIDRFSVCTLLTWINNNALPPKQAIIKEAVETKEGIFEQWKTSQHQQSSIRWEWEVTNIRSFFYNINFLKQHFNKLFKLK